MSGVFLLQLLEGESGLDTHSLLFLQRGVHQQALSLAEALVVLCQAILMFTGHNAQSRTFLQGVLLLAFASCKLISVVHCILAHYLEGFVSISPDEF